MLSRLIRPVNRIPRRRCKFNLETITRTSSFLLMRIQLTLLSIKLAIPNCTENQDFLLPLTIDTPSYRIMSRKTVHSESRTLSFYRRQVSTIYLSHWFDFFGNISRNREVFMRRSILGKRLSDCLFWRNVRWKGNTRRRILFRAEVIFIRKLSLGLERIAYRRINTKKREL